MEEQGLEFLTTRFGSWSNLFSATAILEKQSKAGLYNCDSGCEGCSGCGPNISPSYLVRDKKLSVQEQYECEGCGACCGCSACGCEG